MSIKTAIEESGKTPTEVAEFMGISRTSVYYWMSGECLPEASRLVELADFLGCTVDKLLR